MKIKENDIFPKVTFYKITDSGPTGIKSEELFKNKVILVGYVGRDVLFD